ncbi:MAG TPA: UDP-3-O-acyl-N-acetylglucosamine deacetylase [Candidatus Baltobacteraceae bacterium]|jgi:UDP-3-O-[3-hydroxymyristoyl] N-acetylglucosamine deacetylase|nr:UDP-3-O-acyl-N-acetylglucosamine deacetylase [Candidatus Baltobacteraceae bacterium]
MTDRQQTLRERLVFEGVGLHSGADCRVTIAPAPAGAGLFFRLAGGSVVVPAHPKFVVDSRRATVLGIGDVRVSTVEHLLSALFVMGVDNAAIEVEGPEIPILEGSAASFVRAIETTGTEAHMEPRSVLRLSKPIVARDGDAIIILLPAQSWRVRFTLAFPAPIGVHYFDEEINKSTYMREIAAARTFVSLADVEALHAQGLAKGGSLENALVFDANGPMTPLQWGNEVVRHKVLDLIGDFALLGARPEFETIAIKSGHRLHTRVISQVLEAQTHSPEVAHRS